MLCSAAWLLLDNPLVCVLLVLLTRVLGVLSRWPCWRAAWKRASQCRVQTQSISLPVFWHHLLPPPYFFCSDPREDRHGSSNDSYIHVRIAQRLCCPPPHQPGVQLALLAESVFYMVCFVVPPLLILHLSVYVCFIVIHRFYFLQFSM